MSKVLEVLKTVVHPEHDADLVSLGMITNLEEAKDKISFSLQLLRAKDPMASSLKRTMEMIIEKEFGVTPFISIIEPRPKSKTVESKKVQLPENCRVIAIASGKGGVGKSTVTANLASALSRLGYKVGVFDADIYGPSMPKMFNTEDYTPIADGETEMIKPAESYGLKIMSIGYFITADDALVWRGPMATNALKQLLHETAWGELDYLLLDMPPGTGDIHLTVVNEIKIDGAIIVSTPQQVALADVVRGVKMFQSEHINVPILGLVTNMAYFTPPELPNNRYYIFGKGEIEKVSEKLGTAIIAEIPIVEAIAKGGDNGSPVAFEESITGEAFKELAQKVDCLVR